MTPLDAAAAMLATNRIFSVTFTKKDGTPRKLTGRTGVHKYVTGQGMAWDPATRGMLVVFDMLAKGYRIVTIATVTQLRLNGATYTVAPELRHAA